MQYLQGVGPEYVLDPQWDRLERAIAEAWKPRANFAFYTVCSWAKPYSASHIHHEIRRALASAGLLGIVDYIHISSCGIVPADCELWSTNYDWNNAWVQDDVTLELLRQMIASRLTRFQKSFVYPKSFVYLRPEGNTYRAVFDYTLRRTELVDAFPHSGPKTDTSLADQLRSVRLGQAHDDPDDVLITPSILSGMVQIVEGAVKE